MGFSSKQVPCDDHIQAWNQHHSLIQSSNQDDDNSNIDQRVTSAALRIPIKSGGGGDPLHHHHQKLNCPRCDSTNTKFCYYNNYNRSQPRYFCKSCKRHWTQGGTLRKVPVGGNGRKIRSKISNKRVKTSSSSSSKPKDQGIPAADDKEFRHTIFSPQDQLIWADTSIDFVLGRSLDSTNKGSSFLGRDNSALSLQPPDDQIHQEIQDLTGFHYPSLSPLRCNTIFNSSSSSTPTCSSNHLYESVALEEETIMDVAAGLDAAGNNINDCSINDHQIWKSSVLDATILQGWEEIDKFDITIPWEDEDDP